MRDSSTKGNKKKRRGKRKYRKPDQKKPEPKYEEPQDKRLWWQTDYELETLAPLATKRTEDPIKRFQLSNEVRYSLYSDNSIELYHYNGSFTNLVELSPKVARKLYKELKSVFEGDYKPKKKSKPKREYPKEKKEEVKPPKKSQRKKVRRKFRIRGVPKRSET